MSSAGTASKRVTTPRNVQAGQNHQGRTRAKVCQQQEGPRLSRSSRIPKPRKRRSRIWQTLVQQQQKTRETEKPPQRRASGKRRELQGSRKWPIPDWSSSSETLPSHLNSPHVMVPT